MPSPWDLARDLAIAREQIKILNEKIDDLKTTAKEDTRVTIELRERIRALETRVAVYAVVGGFAAGAIIDGIFEVARRFL